MPNNSHCADVWNPDHDHLVTHFFGGPGWYDRDELGNGLLVYHHQLMHDVLMRKMSQRFAVRREDVRTEVEKLERELKDKMGWENFDKVYRRVRRFEKEMEELCFEGKRVGPVKSLSINEDLDLRATQVRTAELTFFQKYGRLHLHEILQRACDIVDVLQGPPSSVSEDDWKKLMHVRIELRNAMETDGLEAFEKSMEIMERHDALAAKTNLYECELKVPRIRPKDLLGAVETLSQSALSADTWEGNLNIVKKTYPFLRECHSQLPHTRELLREGQLVEKAYEQLLALVRGCLKEGELQLRQKHARFFSQVLDHFGGNKDHDICWKFLNTLSPQERDVEYRASEETRKFFDYLYLHEPNPYEQHRSRYRGSAYQSHVCGYCFSAF